MKYNWDWQIFAQLEPGASGTYLAYLIGGLGWTVVTADGSRAAHFEHTVAVTPDGPEILTRL